MYTALTNLDSQEVIEISRGDVGKKQLVPSEIPDVGKHFSELFEGMKPLFDEKGIQVGYVVGTAGSTSPSPQPSSAPSGPQKLGHLPRQAGESPQLGEGVLLPHFFDIKKIDKVVSNLLSIEDSKGMGIGLSLVG